MTRLSAILLALVLGLAGAAATAQPRIVNAAGMTELDTENPALFELFRALGLYDLMHVFSDETRDKADAYVDQLFMGRHGADWQAAVARIYDPERLAREFEAAWPDDALSAEELDALTGFYTSELGRRIIAGEVESRRVVSDPDAMAAAEDAYGEARANDDPRLDALARFMAASDLIDYNVSGALNANLAFLTGLADGGATELTADELLAQVSADIPMIQADAELWLFAYQTLAYAGLSDAEFEAYIAATATPEGQALNRAMFTAFDGMIERSQYALGREAAELMTSEDI